MRRGRSLPPTGPGGRHFHHPVAGDPTSVAFVTAGKSHARLSRAGQGFVMRIHRPGRDVEELFFSSEGEARRHTARLSASGVTVIVEE
jgi:hypothetical protein